MTGAGGFVGGHLRAALSRLAPAPSVIGTGLEGDVAARLDLTDAAAVDALVAKERPDAVVHLAAQASVGAAQAGAEAKTWAVNLGGTLNLAVAVARHVPDALVLFASSSEVYGRAFGDHPLEEDAAPQPLHAYARSKLLAERVLSEVLPQSAKLIVARPFNHTGPGQREDFALPSFAGQIARIEAGLQPPVLRVGNLDARREFLDVGDVVAAYVALLSAAAGLPPRFTCNISTGSAQPIRQALETLQRLARVPFTIEVDPERLRPADIPFAAGCADRLRAATGWVPTIALETTLAGLLDDARRLTDQTRTARHG